MLAADHKAKAANSYRAGAIAAWHVNCKCGQNSISTSQACRCKNLCKLRPLPLQACNLFIAQHLTDELRRACLMLLCLDLSYIMAAQQPMHQQ